MMNLLETTKDLARNKAYFQNKMAFTTGPVELERLIKSTDNIVVVDVRAAEDYAKGHIPGAINLPKDKWETLEGLQKDKINVLYCYSQVCHLAATAALHFLDKGFAVMEMEGGFKAWKEQEFDIEKQPVHRFHKLTDRLTHK